MQIYQKNLNVDKSTVKRTVKLFQDTGNVMKKVYDKTNLPRKLTMVVQCFILQLHGLEYPGIIIEIRSEVNHMLEVDLDEYNYVGFYSLKV